MAITKEMAMKELARRELERRKSKESPVTPFLPNENKVEEMIGQRSAGLDGFIEKARGVNLQDFINPAQKLGELAVEASGPLFQRGEAALSNVGLELQKGEGDIVDELMKGVKGEKLGQLGDLVRTTGFGGAMNEPLANVAGFMSTVGLTNLATKGKLFQGARKVREAIKTTGQARKAEKAFFFKRRADMLADGSDDVVSSVRQEYDELYKKIGNNIIGPDDKAVVQEAVKIIPKQTFNRFAKLEKLDVSKGVLEADLNTVKKIKGVIGRTIPKKVWSGLDDATPEQSRLMDIYHDLNDVMAKNAGDSKDVLLALNKKYKEVLGFRNIITKMTKTQGTGVTKTSIRNIRSASNQGNLAELEAFSKKFFPKTQDILKDIDRFNRSEKIKKGVGTALKFGVGAEVARRMIVNPTLEQFLPRD